MPLAFCGIGLVGRAGRATGGNECASLGDDGGIMGVVEAELWDSKQGELRRRQEGERKVVRALVGRREA